uniref:C-type lectin domain-containing protein n=1 Tax=Seriola lalandi dorsalis TaxID=1841481 RepID=A0A3B4Z5S4_SERLL
NKSDVSPLKLVTSSKVEGEKLCCRDHILSESDVRIVSIDILDTYDFCLTHLTEKTCPEGWRMFSGTCYLLSTQSGSWEKGREDCRARGADLVIIDSLEEQTLLTGFAAGKKFWWIGLTDRDEEGTWKWIDGTPLTQSYWWEGQPDNGGGDSQWGEEDCAHILTSRDFDKNWNDQSCTASVKWICEKMA